ncbi:hypothetical protein ACFFIO_15735 [Citricoccus parietis]|uniref:Uncharacterized protein n=2 Tax=Citricoccus parietis TaxID=592307 RepID=A0ABV6F9F9_9MICC
MVEAQVLSAGAPDGGGSAPRRHPTLESLCSHLESILWGRAAEQLLAAGPTAGAAPGTVAENGAGPRTLVLLPAWDWRLPAMEIGRKGRDHESGETLLMPVRLDWGGNDALIRVEGPEGPERPYRWTAHSMGWADSGDLSHPGELRPNNSQRAKNPSRVTSLNAIVSDGNYSAPGIHRYTVEGLHDLVRAGRHSQWQLLFSLEPFVTATVHKAHSAVSHEIGALSGRVQAVLHETGIEQVVNVMMVGETAVDSAEDASVSRLLEHCLRPDRFAKVDPLMYLSRNLRRDAEDHIRRAIGDPRIGPKVRRVAAQMPGATLDEIVAAYRLEHPQDKLSTARAQAALNVGSDPMARSVLIDPETNRGAR